MKKTILLMVSLFLVTLLCACGNQAGKWQQQYDLGQQYLNEGNYEEAIIAFSAAIEIDAKQAPVYASRGDAYNGLYTEITENDYTPVKQEFAECAADEDVCLQLAASDYGDAIEIEPAVPEYYEKIVVVYVVLDDSSGIEQWLKQGYEQTNETALYGMVIQHYLDAGDSKSAAYWLDKAYEETQDENLKKLYEDEVAGNKEKEPKEDKDTDNNEPDSEKMNYAINYVGMSTGEVFDYWGYDYSVSDYAYNGGKFISYQDSRMPFVLGYDHNDGLSNSTIIRSVYASDCMIAEGLPAEVTLAELIEIIGEDNVTTGYSKMEGCCYASVSLNGIAISYEWHENNYDDVATCVFLKR